MQSQKGRHRRRVSATAVAAVLSVGAAACSPTFNWRETRAEGSELVVSFPCRPDRHSRAVAVAGITVTMQMLVCSAGGATYALSFYDARDAQAVATGLESLRTGMLANIQAAPPRERPLRMAGLPATPGASRLSADGRRPDGGVLRLEAAFFAKDLRVYQAAVVGPPLTDDAIDPFFEGLKLQD